MVSTRKLHIGAGRVHLPGFINVDLFDTHQAELYCDITRLPYEPNTFDLIYASHVLEHVHRRMVTATLYHWGQLLRPGGVLRLAVPSFKAVCDYYADTGKLEDVMGLLYGGQNHPKNNHFVTFDFNSLHTHLKKAGLDDVRLWDWKNTEHTDYDDYSQCYLPHMDKVHGRLMSLNLEARKPQNKNEPRHL